MSLPTHASFFKNNKIVAHAFCNCGWYLNGVSLKRALVDAWNAAIGIYDLEEIPENLKPYYTNRQDLIEFDYVEVYGYRFSKSVVGALFYNTLKIDEFCFNLNKGVYDVPNKKKRKQRKK